MQLGEQPSAENGEWPTEMVPICRTESITVLRETLHARMVTFHQSGSGGPGSRDELLEERRKQRVTPGEVSVAVEPSSTRIARHTIHCNGLR